MRVLLSRATNKLIEAQSDATAGTLIANAIKAGFLEADVIEMEVSDEEFQLIINPPVEPALQLENDRLAGIVKTYADVDEVYAAAIGNRAEEYKQAEVDARAYKVAGYTGTPTEYISGWATIKGVTNQQSADAIIARADALATAKLAMRNQRFVLQAAMQAAATPAALGVAVTAWATFIAGIKAAI